MTDVRVAGKLGKKAPDHTRPRLRLTPHLTAVPQPPAKVDWLSRVQNWPMYLNDQLGCCTCAMAGHALEAWSTYGQGHTVTVTDQDVLTAYEAVSGYRPGHPETDQGAVMQDVMDYLRKTGIAGHKVLAFAQVNHKDPAEVKAALNVFGTLLVGIEFPASAMDQFNAGQPWDAVRNDGGIEGGHAIHVGHDETGNVAYKCTTWGAVQGMTQAFWDRYVDECWVAIAPEWLSAAGASPGGVDLYGLGEDLHDLTGAQNPFPAPQPTPQPPTPAPGPTPTPVPVRPDGADEAFAQVAAPWSAERHVGENRRVAVAFEKWRKARGL